MTIKIDMATADLLKVNSKSGQGVKSKEPPYVRVISTASTAILGALGSGLLRVKVSGLVNQGDSHCTCVADHWSAVE